MSQAVSKSVDDGLAAEIAAFRRSLSSVSTNLSAAAESEDELEENSPKETLKWSDVYKGDITQHHLEEIQHELGLIKLCSNTLMKSKPSQYPTSYQQNTQKEMLLLWCADNFRQQFHVTFPKRRPILLACNNECGIQKLVCTTIRPTSMRFPELQTCLGCSSFVADYMQYTPLINATALPDQLVSPGEALARQTAHCYELATLLTSLLIGSSFNAFVVSGYATREICMNDTTRSENKYLIPKQINEKEAKDRIDSKYKLEPPRDLRSKFLLRQKEKEKARDAAAKEAKAKAEWEALMEFEKPPFDPLWTHRRHAWVLVLPSKDITEPCFIEPATGSIKKVDDEEYHGIDSIWNHLNYWVAVGQDRLIPSKKINLDLKDATSWEIFLVGPSERCQQEKKGNVRDSKSSVKHLDMPASWVNKINLTHSEYERRYVDGNKTIKYRKCIVQLFAPYIDNAGLITRVTDYSDYECTEETGKRDLYQNRSDLLRNIEQHGDDVSQRFLKGRKDSLKEYKFRSQTRGLPVEFEMVFHAEARADNLSKLNKTLDVMCEEFDGRDDNLKFRRTTFSRTNDTDPKITTILEKFHRNKQKGYSEDPATMEYDIENDKVRIVYNYGKENISAAKRELCLKTMKQIFAYDPDPHATTLRPLALFALVQECLNAKNKAEKSVEIRLRETKDILIRREREMAEPKLLISQFDEGRNQEARELYKERDRKKRLEEERDLSLSVDLLAPYLALLTPPVTLPLPTTDARSVYNQCLQEWKTILLARATDIQRQYDQTLDEIRKGQEDGTIERSDHRYFTLHCLKIRLIRHKEMTPKRYLSIDACLREDHRLINAFSKWRNVADQYKDISKH